jgi:hypothetical protein
MNIIINQFHRAESFFRSHQLRSYLRISIPFMDPESSLPFSQHHVLVPNLDRINPVHTIPSSFSKIHFNRPIILPTTPNSSYWRLSPPGFPTKPLQAFFYSSMCAICPAHFILFYVIILITLQVMTFLIIQFSPTSYHFIPLRPKYSPQHSVLKRPQSAFFS